MATYSYGKGKHRKTGKSVEEFKKDTRKKSSSKVDTEAKVSKQVSGSRSTKKTINLNPTVKQEVAERGSEKVGDTIQLNRPEDAARIEKESAERASKNKKKAALAFVGGAAVGAIGGAAIVGGGGAAIAGGAARLGGGLLAKKATMRGTTWALRGFKPAMANIGKSRIGLTKLTMKGGKLTKGKFVTISKQWASNTKTQTLTKASLLKKGLSGAAVTFIAGAFGTYPMTAWARQEVLGGLKINTRDARENGDFELAEEMMAMRKEIRENPWWRQLPYKNIINEFEAFFEADKLAIKSEERLIAKERGLVELEGLDTGEKIAKRDAERDALYKEDQDKRNEIKVLEREYYRLIRTGNIAEADLVGVELDKLQS